MQLGYIGLGKMGLAQVKRLLEYGHSVVAYNRSEEPRREAEKAGAKTGETIADVVSALKAPRLIWLMVPHAAVDDVLKDLVPHLSKGDTIIDGGNSFYKHSMRRAKTLSKKGINFLDCGTSGGPAGARNGACLMIGGEKKVFEKYGKLFKDLALLDGYAYMGKAGAGHFVKMVHNGIEYGMMQAIGEGFEVLKKSAFKLPLEKVSLLYNRGSVIESKLMGWLAKAFKEQGESLRGISGEVSHSGEGLWTVQTAKELKVPVKVIKDSLDFRVKSKGNPSYTGQVVSALRNQFGGHSVRKANTE
ncbi:MAG: decarboxylating 6-phosphogluconate dehydrogenase [bacterium]|nr:decarboxylating 6-phosphogluconate dehydrogenase [bacterium]